MMSIYPACILLIASATGALAGKGHILDWSYWNYEEHGPADWPGVCRNGTRQSPIDIDLADVLVDHTIPPLEFNNYDKPLTNLSFRNNGHSCTFEVPIDSGVTISGGGLSVVYELVQVHFHWSDALDPHHGSDHTVNKLHYPIEAHFVHEKHGTTVEEALEMGDGLAVVSVAFYLHKENITHSPLQLFYPLLEKIKHEEDTTPLSLTLSDMLPADREQFFRYDGSLTTPYCNEAVIWTLMLEPLPIHQALLNQFASIMDHDGRPIHNNFRPVQPIHNRVVKLRRPGHLTVGAAAPLKAALAANICCLLALSRRFFA